jgi:hypothetical protein
MAADIVKDAQLAKNNTSNCAAAMRSTMVNGYTEA